MGVQRTYKTPLTRGDCPQPEDGPCPHVGCRHNTYLDVGADGSLTILDRVPPGDRRRGSGCSLTESEPEKGLAERWGTTPRAIREIEASALRKLRALLDDRAWAALSRAVEARRAAEEGDDNDHERT